MKRLKLSKGKEALVDDDVYVWASEFKWHFNGRYAARNTSRREKHTTVYLHRVILPGAKEVDHVNGDPLDNRRENLRACTHQQNLRNQKARKRTAGGSLKGAHFKKGNKNPWVARITVDGTSIHLGSFDSEQKAHEAYINKAKQIHGQFFKS